MSRSLWMVTGAGPGSRAAAGGGASRRRRRGSPGGRSRAGARRRDSHLVCVLLRQLAAAGGRGLRADASAPPLYAPGNQPLRKEGVRIRFIGRRDRLDPAVLREVERCERATEHCGRLTFGSRSTIRLATRSSRRPARRSDTRGVRRRAGPRGGSPHSNRRRAAAERLPAVGMRLRGVSVYPTMWPDFGQQDLESAIRNFRSRDRRYGAVA